MRLLNTDTLELAEFFGTVPDYTILSHTWEDEEVSLQEMEHRTSAVTSKKGYQKIVDFCRIAAKQGHAWVWIDTCCIDKANLSELTESINSMFRWYEEAATCYVFLADLPGDAQLQDALPRCRWFTRGWTLQELLAPETVHFYDREWICRGTKTELIKELEAITGILRVVLDRSIELHHISIGVRMSWAADRETTRCEDLAYCLLGIFDVNMPLIYGEGMKAFRRLQEEIIRQSNDLTVFAWNNETEPVEGTTHTGPQLGGPLLASSTHPFVMHSARRTKGWLWKLMSEEARWSEVVPEYAITNKGLRIKACLALVPPSVEEGKGTGVGTTNGEIREAKDNVDDASQKMGDIIGPSYFLPLGEIRGDPQVGQIYTIGMGLLKVGPNLFVRRRGALHKLIRPTIGGSLLTKPIRTPAMQLYIGMSDPSPHDINWARLYGAIHLPKGRFQLQSEPDFRRDNSVAETSSYAVFRVTRAIPESHWDRTRHLFYRDSNNPVVFAFCFTLSIGQASSEFLCVMDERYPSPSVYILGPADDLETWKWFRHRRSTSQGIFWGDLPDPNLHERPGSEWAREIVLGGVTYSIRLPASGDIALGTGSSVSYTLLFHIERLKTDLAAKAVEGQSPAEHLWKHHC